MRPVRLSNPIPPSVAASADSWAQIQPDYPQQNWKDYLYAHGRDFNFYKAYPCSALTFANHGGQAFSSHKKAPFTYTFTVSGMGDGGSTPNCVGANNSWTLNYVGNIFPHRWITETSSGVYWRLELGSSTSSLHLNIDGTDRYRWDFTNATYPDCSDVITATYVDLGSTVCTGMPSTITLTPVGCPSIVFPDIAASTSNVWGPAVKHTSFTATIDDSSTLNLLMLHTRNRWIDEYLDVGDAFEWRTYLPPYCFVRYDSDNVITGVYLNQVQTPEGGSEQFPRFWPTNTVLTMSGATDTDYNGDFLLMADRVASTYPLWYEPEVEWSPETNSKFRWNPALTDVDVIDAGVVQATYRGDSPVLYEKNWPYGDFSDAVTFNKVSGTADWPSTLTMIGKYNVGGYYAKP